MARQCRHKLKISNKNFIQHRSIKYFGGNLTCLFNFAFQFNVRDLRKSQHYDFLAIFSYDADMDFLKL